MFDEIKRDIATILDQINLCARGSYRYHKSTGKDFHDICSETHNLSTADRRA